MAISTMDFIIKELSLNKIHGVSLYFNIAANKL